MNQLFLSPWNPSEEQFQKYKQREIELCKIHMARGYLPHQMLHSEQTVKQVKFEQLAAF